TCRHVLQVHARSWQTPHDHPSAISGGRIEEVTSASDSSEYALTMTLVRRPAHPVTTLLLRSVGLFGSLNWAPRACCCTLGGATARPQGGIYMTTVVLNRRNLLAAGASVLATGVSGLLLPARAEGVLPTPSMPGGSNNYRGGAPVVDRVGKGG